jgi:protein-disulfide isomerase
METYAGSGLVRYEFNDFAFIGQESMRAAEAATCALEQDQFWQYHDTLFLNQKGENAGAFADENLRTLAAAIGLNEGDFSTCLGSNRYRNEINDGIGVARDLGVQSTPTFRINGELVEGLLTFEQFQSIIEEELNAVQ